MKILNLILLATLFTTSAQADCVSTAKKPHKGELLGRIAQVTGPVGFGMAIYLGEKGDSHAIGKSATVMFGPAAAYWTYRILTHKHEDDSYKLIAQAAKGSGEDLMAFYGEVARRYPDVTLAETAQIIRKGNESEALCSDKRHTMPSVGKIEDYVFARIRNGEFDKIHIEESAAVSTLTVKPLGSGPIAEAARKYFSGGAQ